MNAKTIIRRAGAALAVAAMGSVAVAGSAHATLDTDLVLITDPGIDFGDNTYLISAPIGWGSVEWDLVNGYYTPTLTGYLHLDNVSGQYGRMHMSYWDGGPNPLYTDHSPPHRVYDNRHHQSPVLLSPSTPMQITEVHVCTELSPNGSTWTQIGCATNELY